MVYCSKCGNNFPEDAYFCPHCGVRTQAGVEAGAASPSDEIRESLSRMGKEMEKAFTIAAKEVHEAFKTARDNLRQTPQKEDVKCVDCGETNSSDDKYCGKCGRKLA